ncbi:hypothetical protein NDK43_09275 [Neobacillus pocheonensis]|uniref:XkdX family protein n=1 Tax=Neobacillus pocheonensis TaxID=363869 RepID=A0ABT0WAK0_9BACI|nr:hypothetical protein [Neobacillus pocheonensis]
MNRIVWCVMEDHWTNIEMELIKGTDLTKLTWEEIKAIFPDKNDTKLIKK